jgi:hypothetical protein
MQFALLSVLSLVGAAAAQTVIVCGFFLSHGFVKFNDLFSKSLYKSELRRLPQEVFSSSSLPALTLRTVPLLPSNSLECRSIPPFSHVHKCSKLHAVLSPGNHSVTQSTFSNPCQPETGGFDSGWVQILSAETEIPEWNLTITDDAKRPSFFPVIIIIQ